MLQPGSLAPTFALPDQNGIPVALADLRGRWVVLYFYPKDDTPGCTIEACAFTAALPDFGGLHAEVLGCSSDDSASHTQFIAKYKLGIRLLTDTDRSVMRAYGAFGMKTVNGKEVEGMTRATTLIAPDGTVAHHWASVKAEGHAEEVRAKLAELQGVTVAAAVVQPTVTLPSVTPMTAVRTTTKAAPAKAKAHKPVAKKQVAKKTAPKKSVSKKAAPKKPTAKKTAPKKAVAKKASPKKAVAKKAVAKKANKAVAKKVTYRVAAKPATKPTKKSKA